MRVERLVNSIFNSNSYLLTHTGNEKAWVVDPGDVQPILDLLASRQLIGILLTHTHFDHIYGINGLLEAFPDAIIYTSGFGVEGLACDRLNGSRYMEISFTVEHHLTKMIQEGDRIELWPEIELEVWQTEGHNRDCVTFYTPGYVFTGDALIPELKVVAKGKYADKEQMIISLKKILERSKPEDVICPGHNQRCLVRRCKLPDLEAVTL